MRYPNPTRRASTRLLAGILTWTFVLGQVMQPVYAQTTPLGDVPIAAKVAAKPNIVYTLDDSGSMNLNFLPDFVTAANTATNPAFCRGSILTSGLGEPYYNKDATSTFNVTTTACGGGGASFTTPFNFPAFYASDFNHLAYNPGVTYTPPIKADGTPLYKSLITDAAGEPDQPRDSADGPVQFACIHRESDDQRRPCRSTAIPIGRSSARSHMTDSATSRAS